MTTTTETAPQAAGTGPRKLEGRVALVTGGTRGIGAAITRSLATQGAVVAAGYTSNDEAAEKFLDEFRKSGAEGSVHKGNIAECDDCQRVVQEAIDEHGRLDILVNNAGITADKPMLKMGAEDWDKVIQVNLSGAFYMSKPALEHMIERGSGRIVNISSIIGQIGNVGQANYAASKAALIGFTKALALEIGSRSVTVNAIAPGFITTGMTDAMTPEARKSLEDRIALRRLGTVDDVAYAVVFLASEQAGYITGTVLNVSGGLYT
jgi:3-oxoacyl-(acyl-carrier-protein) reductase